MFIAPERVKGHNLASEGLEGNWKPFIGGYHFG
jgi:hypothetical protein